MQVFPRHGTRFLVFCTDETDDEDGRVLCTGLLEIVARWFSDVVELSGEIEGLVELCMSLAIAVEWFSIVDRDAIGLGKDKTTFRSGWSP